MDTLEYLVRLVEQARELVAFAGDMCAEMESSAARFGPDVQEYPGGPTWFALAVRYRRVYERALRRLRRRQAALRRTAPRDAETGRRVLALMQQVQSEGTNEYD